MLDGVLLGELVAIYRTDELLKFIERLFAQIVSVYEEENAFSTSVLDKPIAEVDGSKVLPLPVAILD